MIPPSEENLSPEKPSAEPLETPPRPSPPRFPFHAPSQPQPEWATSAQGYFGSVHSFLDAVHAIVEPRLAALEERLRSELTAMRGTGAAAGPPSPPPTATPQVVYKTSIAVYAMVVLSLLLSLIALSR